MMSSRVARSAAASALFLCALVWCVACVALLASTPVVAQPAGSAEKQKSFVQNFSRLQEHLRRLLGNPQIRIVQKDKDSLIADLLIGDKRVGSAEQDEDDEDFLTVTVEIPENEVSENKKLDAPKAEAYLRTLLGSSRIRVVPGKEGNVEVFADKEALGDLEPGSPVTLMMVVEQDEMPVATETLLAAIEPVDAANSIYYARTDRVPVREKPSADAPAVAHLSEDQQIKVTGRTKNSRTADERWYQVAYADGKPRYVLGKDLLSEKSKLDKSRYRRLSTGYARFLEQIGNSQGALAKYMGFFTLGPDCALRPFQTSANMSSLAQRLEDLRWATTSWTLWTDGTYVFRARVEDGEVARFKPSPIRTMKTQNLGEVRFYRLDRLEPPGLDADLTVTGFTEQGKLLIGVQLDGNKFKYLQATRCNNLPLVKNALSEFYKEGMAHLPADR